MSVTSIHCGKCHQPLDGGIVFTSCKGDRENIVLHIFHNQTNCLADWVNRAEKTCPFCRGPLFHHQLGKNMTQLLRIFLDALVVQDDRTIALSVLTPAQNTNDECSICFEGFPIIRYKDGSFYHEQCSSDDLQHIYMKRLALAASAIVNKHPHLKKQFTPTPPTLLQRILTDYPLLFRVVVIGSISISALTFNRYKYGGESWILFGLGFPAYLTLVVAHQVGMLVIALLNSQQ